MNASPSNQSRKIFIDRVVPQLGYNSGSLREILVKDSVTQPDGTVAYPVNRERFDHFFTSLSCGIICKSCKKSLPINYSIQHIYHDFYDSNKSLQEENIELMLLNFYTGKPMEAMDFGQVNALNTSVYSVKIFGVPNFRSSITIVHKFFGAFRVTSMLTNTGKH